MRNLRNDQFKFLGQGQHKILRSLKQGRFRLGRFYLFLRHLHLLCYVVHPNPTAILPTAGSRLSRQQGQMVRPKVAENVFIRFPIPFTFLRFMIPPKSGTYLHPPPIQDSSDNHGIDLVGLSHVDPNLTPELCTIRIEVHIPQPSDTLLLHDHGVVA